MTTNEPKYMDQYESDWDRDDESPCDPHYVEVNDRGIPQCTECLCLFSFIDGKKAIIDCIKEQCGPLWEEEYERLKEIGSLVRRKRFDKLDPVEYTFYDRNRKIKTVRIFYKKARPD